MIRACGLGYADGHSLEAYLRRRGGLRTAQELGLLRRAERADRGRPGSEFFAGRVVVPELRGGQCLWMIGRAVQDTPGRPKYLALSGERPVLGLERAAGRRQAFLCEGVFDYVTAVSWRLPAWSPCGTHLPPERLGFLARAEVVWGVFDGDAAGRAATERFAALLGEPLRGLRLPGAATSATWAGAPRGGPPSSACWRGHGPRGGPRRSITANEPAVATSGSVIEAGAARQAVMQQTMMLEVCLDESVAAEVP